MQTLCLTLLLQHLVALIQHEVPDRVQLQSTLLGEL